MSTYFRATKPLQQPLFFGFPPVHSALQLRSQNIPELQTPENFTGLFTYNGNQSPPLSHLPTSTSRFQPHPPTPVNSPNLSSTLTGTLETISTTPPTLLIRPHHPTEETSQRMLPLSAPISQHLLPVFLLYTSYKQHTVTFRLDINITPTNTGLPVVKDAKGVGVAWADAIAASADLKREMNPPVRKTPRRNRKKRAATMTAATAMVVVVKTDEDEDEDRGDGGLTDVDDQRDLNDLAKMGVLDLEAAEEAAEAMKEEVVGSDGEECEDW